jgi:curved DNA-binding protein CbpA
MKQDYYSVLGVNKDARSEEIKAAYRDKASEHHPDHGGSESAMALLNVAYRTLRDPSSRKYYDQHGEEEDVSVVDQMARDLILSNFDKIIRAKEIDVDIIPTVIKVLQVGLDGELKTKYEMETILTRLDARKGIVRLKGKKTKVKVKKRNLWTMLIEDSINNIKSDILKCENNIEAHRKAILMLNDYESDDLSPKPEESADKWVYVRVVWG